MATRSIARFCDLHASRMGTFSIARQFQADDYKALWDKNSALLPPDVKVPQSLRQQNFCHWQELTASLADDQAGKRAATVHVQGDFFQDWLVQVWPRVEVPIVLVTGESDLAFPGEMDLDVDSLRAFLEDPRIVHWYTQNMDLGAMHHGMPFLPLLEKADPELPVSLQNKLSPIPIGVDFHTLSEKVGPGITFHLPGRGWAYPLNFMGAYDRVKWGTPYTPAEVQQGVIDGLVFSMPTPAERPLKALVNWGRGGQDPRGAARGERSGRVNSRGSLLADLPEGSHWEQRAQLPRLEVPCGWCVLLSLSR